MGRLAVPEGMGKRGGAVEAVGKVLAAPLDPPEVVVGGGRGREAEVGAVATTGGGPRSKENPPARPINRSAAPPASELTPSSSS